MGAGKTQEDSDQLEILIYPERPNAASEAQSPARKK
jgi:hypothetical protein